jgi:hypothetical protein
MLIVFAIRRFGAGYKFFRCSLIRTYLKTSLRLKMDLWNLATICCFLFKSSVKNMYTFG